MQLECHVFCRWLKKSMNQSLTVQHNFIVNRGEIMVLQQRKGSTVRLADSDDQLFIPTICCACSLFKSFFFSLNVFSFDFASSGHHIGKQVSWCKQTFSWVQWISFTGSSEASQAEKTGWRELILESFCVLASVVYNSKESFSIRNKKDKTTSLRRMKINTKTYALGVSFKWHT